MNGGFLHPASPRDVPQGGADHLAVADDRSAARDALQGDLVALRDAVSERQTAGELRAGRQAKVVDDDGNVVGLGEADIERLVGRPGGSRGCHGGTCEPLDPCHFDHKTRPPPKSSLITAGSSPIAGYKSTTGVAGRENPTQNRSNVEGE